MRGLWTTCKHIKHKARQHKINSMKFYKYVSRTELRAGLKWSVKSNLFSSLSFLSFLWTHKANVCMMWRKKEWKTEKKQRQKTTDEQLKLRKTNNEINE